jgi:hypothetical protein
MRKELYLRIGKKTKKDKLFFNGDHDRILSVVSITEDRGKTKKVEKE